MGLNRQSPKKTEDGQCRLGKMFKENKSELQDLPPTPCEFYKLQVSYDPASSLLILIQKLQVRILEEPLCRLTNAVCRSN